MMFWHSYNISAIGNPYISMISLVGNNFSTQLLIWIMADYKSFLFFLDFTHQNIFSGRFFLICPLNIELNCSCVLFLLSAASYEIMLVYPLMFTFNVSLVFVYFCYYFWEAENSSHSCTCYGCFQCGKKED